MLLGFILKLTIFNINFLCCLALLGLLLIYCCDSLQDEKNEISSLTQNTWFIYSLDWYPFPICRFKVCISLLYENISCSLLLLSRNSQVILCWIWFTKPALIMYLIDGYCSRSIKRTCKQISFYMKLDRFEIIKLQLLLFKQIPFTWSCLCFGCSCFCSLELFVFYPCLMPFNQV